MGDTALLGRSTASPSSSRPESSQSMAQQTDASSTGGSRKHPPTRLYIEADPQQKGETFVRWKQQQQEREQRSYLANKSEGETRHLSDLEKQIEAVQQIEGGAGSDASAASTPSEGGR